MRSRFYQGIGKAAQELADLYVYDTDLENRAAFKELLNNSHFTAATRKRAYGSWDEEAPDLSPVEIGARMREPFTVQDFSAMLDAKDGFTPMVRAGIIMRAWETAGMIESAGFGLYKRTAKFNQKEAA